jgi:hypothetical protein
MYTTTLLLANRKHPYLMYSGILSGCAGLWSLRGRLWNRRVVEGGFELMEPENAEVVRDRILGLKDYVSLGLTAIGFAIAVIGNLGEGMLD